MTLEGCVCVNTMQGCKSFMRAEVCVGGAMEKAGGHLEDLRSHRKEREGRVGAK